MAFKISGNTVIDDNRQVVLVGIATIGSGSSAVTFTDSGNTTVGSGITINVDSGDVSIGGTIFIGNFSVSPVIINYSPGIGSTSISSTTDITLTFNNGIEFVSGATTSLTIGLTTTAGAATYTYSTDSPNVSINRNVLTITQPPTGYFGGIPEGLYDFQIDPTPVEGLLYEGGYVICVDAGSRCAWLIAPPSAELGRDWFGRTDANTCAETVTGYSGWFIASSTQWQNPGYSCRTNWPFNPGTYWTNTQLPSQGTEAYYINMSTGTLGSCQPNDQAYSGPGNAGTPVGRNVRSFRCITY
jgi:hypothetical protein